MLTCPWWRVYTMVVKAFVCPTVNLFLVYWKEHLRHICKRTTVQQRPGLFRWYTFYASLAPSVYAHRTSKAILHYRSLLARASVVIYLPYFSVSFKGTHTTLIANEPLAAILTTKWLLPVYESWYLHAMPTSCINEEEGKSTKET